jgi:hypothetical protein
MKIKVAMTIGACAFALWGCGSDSETGKFDGAADVSTITKDSGTTIKTDGGMMGDADEADALTTDGGSVSPDAPQILDGGAVDAPATDAPLMGDAMGDAMGDVATSDVGG